MTKNQPLQISQGNCFCSWVNSSHDTISEVSHQTL